MIRGLFTFNGVLYAVSDSDLLRIDSAGNASQLGSLDSGAGPVDFEQTLTQLVITDGYKLYVLDGATLTETDNWTAGARIAFVDQRIVGIQRASQRFQWTALGDALVADLFYVNSEVQIVLPESFTTPASAGFIPGIGQA